MTKSNAAATGTPILFVAFLGLLIAKMGFGVNIAWLWVTAPLWVPFALALGVTVLLLVVAGIFLGVGAIVGAIQKGFREAKRNQRAPGLRTA